jgi:hypothetical protein
MGGLGFDLQHPKTNREKSGITKEGMQGKRYGQEDLRGKAKSLIINSIKEIGWNYFFRSWTLDTLNIEIN